MPVQIKIDQPGSGAPPGVAGQAREDLVVGFAAQLTAVGGPYLAYQWSIIDKPVNIITGSQSSALLGSPNASTSSLTPIDLSGTFLVQVVVDSGFGLGATPDDIATITFYAGTVPLSADPEKLPRRQPAFRETNQHNVPDAVFPSGNPRGWAQEWERWFAVMKKTSAEVGALIPDLTDVGKLAIGAAAGAMAWLGGTIAGQVPVWNGSEWEAVLGSGVNPTWSQVLDNGNTTDGFNPVVSAGDTLFIEGTAETTAITAGEGAFEGLIDISRNGGGQTGWATSNLGTPLAAFISIAGSGSAMEVVDAFGLAADAIQFFSNSDIDVQFGTWINFSDGNNIAKIYGTGVDSFFEYDGERAGDSYLSVSSHDNAGDLILQAPLESLAGGDVIIRTGHVNGTPGNALFRVQSSTNTTYLLVNQASSGGGANTGGAFTMTLGTATTSDLLVLSAFPGNDVSGAPLTLSTSPVIGVGLAPTAGLLTIQGGSAFTDGTGASVYVKPGAGAGTGTDGSVQLQDATGSAIVTLSPTRNLTFTVGTGKTISAVVDSTTAWSASSSLVSFGVPISVTSSGGAVSTTGLVRLRNQSILMTVRNGANTQNMHLFALNGDNIVVGDINAGGFNGSIQSGVPTGFGHQWFVNGAVIATLTAAELEVSAGVRWDTASGTATHSIGATTWLSSTTSLSAFAQPISVTSGGAAVATVGDIRGRNTTQILVQRNGSGVDVTVAGLTATGDVKIGDAANAPNLSLRAATSTIVLVGATTIATIDNNGLTVAATKRYDTASGTATHTIGGATWLSSTATLSSFATNITVGGGNVSTTGKIRAAGGSATILGVRNVGNTADMTVISTDASDNVFFGHATDITNVLIRSSTETRLQNGTTSIAIIKAGEVELQNVPLDWSGSTATLTIAGTPWLSSTTTAAEFNLATVRFDAAISSPTFTQEAATGTNNGQNLTISAQTGGVTSGNGGTLILAAGSAATNGSGGSVHARVGAANGGGDGSAASFKVQNSTASTTYFDLFGFDSNGKLRWGGTGTSDYFIYSDQNGFKFGKTSVEWRVDVTLPILSQEATSTASATGEKLTIAAQNSLGNNGIGAALDIRPGGKVGGSGTGAGGLGRLTTGLGAASAVTQRFGWNDTGIGFFTATPIAQPTRVGQLTDSTTGTPSATVNNVGGSFNQATLNNNFASILAKINGIESRISQAASGLGLTA